MFHDLYELGETMRCSKCGAITPELTTACVGRPLNIQERQYILQKRLDFNVEGWRAQVGDKMYIIAESPLFTSAGYSAVSVAALHYLNEQSTVSLNKMSEALARLAASVADFGFDTVPVEKPKPFWQRLRGRWGK